MVAAARRHGSALAISMAQLEAATLAVIGLGTAQTAAFTCRTAAVTGRAGIRAADGLGRSVRRGSGRATGATKRGTRRAAAATRRAATRLVPDPVVVAGDTAAGDEPAAVAAEATAAPEERATTEADGLVVGPRPAGPDNRPRVGGPADAAGRDSKPGDEAAAVGAQPVPWAAATTTAERPAPAGGRPGGGPPGPLRRPREGHVVPLRPRITTRLKATAELLVLVMFLGLVASSIIVALAVGINQVLSRL
jgi:hypothetical protein